MYKSDFARYLNETNATGSGKAASYVRALDLISEMLRVKSYEFADCIEIWQIGSVDRVHELQDFVIREAKKGKESPWVSGQIPVSYLRDGFCSAALASYQQFLIEHQHTKAQLEIFESYRGAESELPLKLERKLNYPKWLIEGLDPKEGRDVIRAVKTRLNQKTFSQIVFKNYNSTCCVTGLDIPKVNRASHIIGWADPRGKKIRLDPRNGLCLSATYDAAFDKHLISLDDDKRIILSKEIKEHYTSASVQTYFRSKEGDRIILPDHYGPKAEYLAHHRSKGSF